MSTPKHDDDSSRPFLDAGRPSEDDLELSELDTDPDRHPESPTDPTPSIHPLHPNNAGPPPAPGQQSPLTVTLALLLCVLGFTINTEATAYFQDELGWKKPFATLYVTHGALILPWLGHIAWRRVTSRPTTTPYSTWVRDYNDDLRASISTVDAYATDGPRLVRKRRGRIGGPLDFLATAAALLTLVLTVSGVSWFLALSLTTPSDLTAIYTPPPSSPPSSACPSCTETLRWPSLAAVALSLLGTAVIAYGDTTAPHDVANPVGTDRWAGNLVACVGALAFGLYERPDRLLHPRHPLARPPAPPHRPHRAFELPSAHAALWILIAVLTGAFSITLLAVLVIWTDPIFGSFANVLSVFSVALSDWVFFDLSPSLATYAGGALVVVAFGLLAWDTFAGARKKGHG
ncbi:DUF6 domain protein [Teratosphaeria destructans]|uniref:DUF6 domain protein n=1 Tax=Teratosphaeria destructans TaxID=418781 RepID=A0A9W7W097_9PEZI|nr:DUF6 domain protein [Teratosphaeria destructans]